MQWNTQWEHLHDLYSVHACCLLVVVVFALQAVHIERLYCITLVYFTNAWKINRRKMENTERAKTMLSWPTTRSLLLFSRVDSAQSVNTYYSLPSLKVDLWSIVLSANPSTISWTLPSNQGNMSWFPLSECNTSWLHYCELVSHIPKIIYVCTYMCVFAMYCHSSRVQRSHMSMQIAIYYQPQDQQLQSFLHLPV